MPTSWASLEVEKAWLEVKQEGERMEQELMQLIWNLSTSQDYVVRILGGIVQGSDVLQVDLGGIEGFALENEMEGVLEKIPETVVTDAPEGSGLRPYLEKVLEVEAVTIHSQH